MSVVKENNIAGYRWDDVNLTRAHNFFLPTLLKEMQRLETWLMGERCMYERGCGNGSAANVLSHKDWDATTQAARRFPNLKLFEGAAYDDLAGRYSQFLRVVEHVYFPRKYATMLFSLLKPRGGFVSTPYHGYWKNLVFVLTGKTDAHLTAVWDHGHIKFWLIKTIDQLLREAGFVEIRYRSVGRVPIIAKLMLAIARKP